MFSKLSLIFQSSLIIFKKKQFISCFDYLISTLCLLRLRRKRRKLYWVWIFFVSYFRKIQNKLYYISPSEFKFKPNLVQSTDFTFGIFDIKLNDAACFWREKKYSITRSVATKDYSSNNDSAMYKNFNQIQRTEIQTFHHSTLNN